MNADGSLVASCTIKNTGAYDAEEAVQLYIGDKVASVVRPVKELKGFDKVLIKAGESVTVDFTVTAEMLAFTHLMVREVPKPAILICGLLPIVTVVHQ